MTDTAGSPTGGESAEPAARASEVLGQLAFRHEWRKYQTMILERFEARDPAVRTFHVVAPPGAGKTIVGLEIARRIGRPAVTFSPTTHHPGAVGGEGPAIPPGGQPEGEDALSCTSAPTPASSARSARSPPGLATAGNDQEFTERLGRARWLAELVDAGRREEGATDHLNGLRHDAAAEYRSGVSARASREVRRLLATGEADIGQLLHPNALDLVERIVAAGTGVVILDEAHHLLDYWAMILRELIRRLPDALVVGLTATPPADGAPEGMEHYLALVNGIDFEVPTPAVVKSGSLAPYQDLVLVTEPTSRKRGGSCARAEERLEAAIARVFADERFLPRLRVLVNGPSGDGAPWPALLADDFEVAVAGRPRVARGR